MAAILQTAFANEYSWMKIYVFWFNFFEFLPRVPINSIPELVQIISWRRSGSKPLSEPMMISLLTHMCVTRSHWVEYKACIAISDSIYIIQFTYPTTSSAYLSRYPECRVWVIRSISMLDSFTLTAIKVSDDIFDHYHGRLEDKWKYFLRYWPFVRGIHRSPVAQRPVTWSFDVFFDLCLNTVE